MAYNLKKKLFVLKQIWIYFYFFIFKIPTNTTIFIHPRHLLLHHLPYPHPNPQSSPKCGHCRFFNIFIQNPYLLTWRIIKKKIICFKTNLNLFLFFYFQNPYKYYNFHSPPPSSSSSSLSPPQPAIFAEMRTLPIF